MHYASDVSHHKHIAMRHTIGSGVGVAVGVGVGVEAGTIVGDGVLLLLPVLLFPILRLFPAASGVEVPLLCCLLLLSLSKLRSLDTVGCR